MVEGSARNGYPNLKRLSAEDFRVVGGMFSFLGTLENLLRKAPDMGI